jgi:hypothetical protein
VLRHASDCHPCPALRDNVHGDTADVYFQCHCFDVSTDPWTIVSHLVFDGSARKVDGTWLLSHADAPAAREIPVPGQTRSTGAADTWLIAEAPIANC